MGKKRVWGSGEIMGMLMQLYISHIPRIKERAWE